MYSQKDFDKITELILQYVDNADSIILFGSYARGEAGESSDMDFAVLTETKIERREKLRLLSKISRELMVQGYNADILIKSKEDYFNDRTLPTLSRVIDKEGKYLWTKGYII